MPLDRSLLDLDDPSLDAEPPITVRAPQQADPSAMHVESAADRATAPRPGHHALLRDSCRHTEAAIEILE